MNSKMSLQERGKKIALIFLRLTLAIGFLYAVADRFGLWGPPGTPNVFWGDFKNFLNYTAVLNPYIPEAFIPFIGWAATIAEIVIGIGLLAGYRLPLFSLMSGILLILFSIGMIVGIGIAAPLAYSVFTAAAASFLMAAVAWTNKRSKLEI